MKPTSITCEECPIHYPLVPAADALQAGRAHRIYVDVAPQAPNGTVVPSAANNLLPVLLWRHHRLRWEGRLPRHRCPIKSDTDHRNRSFPPNFTDMAREHRAILQSLNIDKAMIVGHSMGGMLAARFCDAVPGVTERLVIFNPVGLTDARFDRPFGGVDEAYKADAGVNHPIRASLMRTSRTTLLRGTTRFESFTRIR